MTRQTNWNIYLQVELLQVHVWGNSGSFWFCNLVLHQIWVSQYFHKMSFGLWCYKMGLAFSMPILRGWRRNRISLATELEHYALWIKYCSIYGIFAWFDQNEKLDTEIPKSPLCLLLINAGGMTSMWPLAFFFSFPPPILIWQMWWPCVIRVVEGKGWVREIGKRAMGAF